MRDRQAAHRLCAGRVRVSDPEPAAGVFEELRNVRDEVHTTNPFAYVTLTHRLPHRAVGNQRFEKGNVGVFPIVLLMATQYELRTNCY